MIGPFALKRMEAALEMGRIRAEATKVRTLWEITSIWMLYDNVGGSFEVATWRDPPEDRMRARVVLGPLGFEKHAWRTAQFWFDRRPWAEYTGW